MKKEYIRPEMKKVELKQRTMILAASTDDYGMKRSLMSSEEVDEAW